MPDGPTEYLSAVQFRTTVCQSRACLLYWDLALAADSGTCGLRSRETFASYHGKRMEPSLHIAELFWLTKFFMCFLLFNVFLFVLIFVV